MRIGKLRHNVEIQRRHEASDRMASASEEWITVHAPVSASIEPLNGRELYAAQQHHADVTVRIRIRFREGITADMRVMHKGVAYRVLYPINPQLKNHELQLLCSAGLNLG